MSKRERRRLVVLSQVKSGKLSLGTVVELARVSYRPVKRLRSRYQSVGEAKLRKKGRVERMNRTLKDRLVKARRRRKISDLAPANRYLAEHLASLNAKFEKSPAEATILAVHEERVVQNDWTVRWQN